MSIGSVAANWALPQASSLSVPLHGTLTGVVCCDVTVELLRLSHCPVAARLPGCVAVSRARLPASPATPGALLAVSQLP